MLEASPSATVGIAAVDATPSSGRMATTSVAAFIPPVVASLALVEAMLDAVALDASASKAGRIGASCVAPAGRSTCPRVGSLDEAVCLRITTPLVVGLGALVGTPLIGASQATGTIAATAA